MRDLQHEKNKQENLKQELKQQTEVTPLQLYTEFMRGLLANEALAPVEYSAMEKYRQEHSIDEEMHSECLGILEMTSTELEESRVGIPVRHITVSLCHIYLFIYFLFILFFIFVILLFYYFIILLCDNALKIIAKYGYT